MNPRLTLREAREKRAWTQAELADRADLAQGHLSEMETGDRLPRPDTMRRLGEALNMDALITADGLRFEERAAVRQKKTA